MGSQLPQNLLSVNEISSIRLCNGLEQLGFLLGAELYRPIVQGQDGYGHSLLEQVPFHDDFSFYHSAGRDSHDPQCYSYLHPGGYPSLVSSGWNLGALPLVLRLKAARKAVIEEEKL